MDDLRGKTAFITGGASGIGLATAHRLGREGMNLVIADIEESSLANAEMELSAAGFSVFVAHCDVRSMDDLDAAAQATLRRFGGVQVVFNNAGVVTTGRVEDLTDAAWRWVLDVNLWGVINGCRVFLPILKTQGEPAHIVNTASMAGLNGGPLMSPYYVSKFGVVALSESVWHECWIDDAPIGVSVLCPGFVRTRIAEADRNRPEDLEHAWVGDHGRSFIERLGGGILGGIDASEVADDVHDAIRTRRFWVLPNRAETHNVVRRRADAIIEGSSPVFGDG